MLLNNLLKHTRKLGSSPVQVQANQFRLGELGQRQSLNWGRSHTGTCPNGKEGVIERGQKDRESRNSWNSWITTAGEHSRKWLVYRVYQRKWWVENWWGGWKRQGAGVHVKQGQGRQQGHLLADGEITSQWDDVATVMGTDLVRTKWWTSFGPTTDCQEMFWRLQMQNAVPLPPAPDHSFYLSCEISQHLL